jgi:hypothetical protein
MYSTRAADSSYRRRVTVIESAPEGSVPGNAPYTFIVEYLGAFQGKRGPHSLTKNPGNKEEYVRTSTKTKNISKKSLICSL